MRESDTPPPGDPAMRRSRPWALIFIAAILIFLVWFAIENWGTRRPGGGDTSGPGPNPQATE
jgi:hypothetical protein